MRLSILVSLSLALTGCLMNGRSKSTVLRETIHQYNDEVRWGRVGRGAVFVDSEEVADYYERHAKTGEEIKISDYELQAIQLNSKEDEAVVVYKISWYRADSLLQKESVVKQQWQERADSYALVSEKIISGDDGLFHTTPEGDEEENEDDEGWIAGK